MPAQGLLDLIGHTPLVEIRRMDTGPCRLFVKLECQNPGGSIKDRIGLSMIDAAERDGRLKPGGTIVEATAGNTGLGLALVASAKGYRLILVVPDKMAREKIFHLKAMGAEVRLTRSDVGKGHPEYYQDMAERLAKEIPGAFYINQFGNPANPLAHETGTGPEILEQMDGDIDAMVCGVGSAGTITGLSRFFAKASPKTEMVLADPVGSVLVDYITKGSFGEAGSWVVEGIGEDFIPEIADFSRVKKGYSIPDVESVTTARELLTKEGILGGSSSGTLVAAALRYCREQKTPKRVCTFVCDSGNKYLSKVFNDYWMIDQGFMERPRHGDLRDLITRRFDEGGTVTVGPDDKLSIAYSRMKLYDVSQLPVMHGDRIVGLIDEYDLLHAVQGGSERFAEPVKTAMTQKLDTVDLNTPPAGLNDTFERGHVAIVVHDGKFYGLITQMDVLNHLRRTVSL
ncbi:MAG: cystathionine beta-synthase [Burkholderiales bacterium]|nr:cystathionine beta-synthase [Burkholderiales bacterium]